MHAHLATFTFQTANFLVLVAVLRYWLYRPVQAMIARRQREVEAPLAAAAADQATAAELRAEAERQHLAATNERDRFLLEAGRDAEARRDQLLGEARCSADAVLKEGRAALERERAAAESQLEAQATDLAAAIAGRLLAVSDAEGATAHLLDQAVLAIESMDGAIREAAARGVTGAGAIRVVTAVPVTDERRGAVAARLRQALGPGTAIAFSEEPALLAGAEIYLSTAVVRHSWRETLAEAQRLMKAS